MLTRIRSATKWVRRHPWLATVILLCVCLVSVNALAYQQARAMLWFVRDGSRTLRPDQLSTLGKIAVLATGVRVPRPENDRTPLDNGLDFYTKRIEVVSDIVLEVWVLPADASQGTVLLLHGYAGAKCDLLAEAKVFHELGYVVWLVDFRGSGGSSENYTTIGYSEAEDVAATITRIREDSEDQPLIVYARSMGAAAILRAVHIHKSKVDAVILESVFDRLQVTVGNRFRQMGLPAYPAANLLIFWGGICTGFNGGEHNPVEYAPSCHCPTLFLHGEIDPNATLQHARNVQTQSGDRDSELVVFEKTGHTPTIAADFVRWKGAVSRLLARIR
jgi:alpha-beta hydrolase superfamily lysophospholipase